MILGLAVLGSLLVLTLVLVALVVADPLWEVLSLVAASLLVAACAPRDRRRP